MADKPSNDSWKTGAGIKTGLGRQFVLGRGLCREAGGLGQDVPPDLQRVQLGIRIRIVGSAETRLMQKCSSMELKEVQILPVLRWDWRYVRAQTGCYPQTFWTIHWNVLCCQGPSIDVRHQ